MEAGLSHSVPFRNISLLFLTCYLINRRANELIWWPLVGLDSQQIGSETVDFDGWNGNEKVDLIREDIFGNGAVSVQFRCNASALWAQLHRIIPTKQND